MAVTTTARFGAERPGAGGDPFSRAQYLTLLDAVEAKAAKYADGTAAARPAAGASGVAGTVYTATDTGEVSFSTGTVWVPLSNTTAEPRWRDAFLTLGD